MTLSTISIAATDRLLICMELDHDLWPAPLRYANDTRDWTVTQDGTLTVYPARVHQPAAGGSDDSGADSRQVAVPDEDRALWRQCQAVVGAVDEDGAPLLVRALITEYAASDPTTALRVTRLDLNMPTVAQDGSLSFTLAASDLADRSAPVRKYKTQTHPALRR